MIRMPSKPSVLIYEFFTGGGCPEGPLPQGPAAEALGMLWAALTDFRNWGAVHTMALLDPRFEECVSGLNRNTLPADEVVCALPGSHETLYHSLLKRCDAVLIVAPETNGILAGLTAQAEIAGKMILGSSASAAMAAGDKAACSRIWNRAKLPTPETRMTRFASADRVAKQMKCPLIAKPVDGIGSEGVFRLDGISELPAILGSIRKVTGHDHLLLQSYVEGIPVSVSLMVLNGRCLPLSLNGQLMEAGSAFRYLGSQVPYDHPAREDAIALACSAVRLIPGLHGYVGVDMVLSKDTPQLIEINPRMTTSYIGLRQVAQANLAQVIWDTCRTGVLPDRIPLSGRVAVKKDDPTSWRLWEKGEG
jgi:predicted ATP-grasp superfamily ATP-dependent carboligase